MPTPGTAQHIFYVWPDMAVHIGPMLPSGLHRHYALQVCLGIDGPFELRSAERDEWRTYVSAVVPSGARHQTRQGPGHLVMGYLDPLSTLSRGIRTLIDGAEGPSPLPAEVVAPVVAQLPGVADRPAAIRRAIENLQPPTPAAVQPVDARVELAQQILSGRAATPLTLTEVAHRTRLSAARLRHLFRAQIGVSFSEFRLWSRVVVAAHLLAETPDLTWAAHEAGFADSAHFSRTFRRVFGLRPSEVFKSAGWRVVLCGSGESPGK